ncbi:hypothetical protein R6Q59_028952 [Mikania micrantha]
MEHYKSRNNDYFHFTNPHDDVSEFDDDDVYDGSQSCDVDDDRSCDFNFHTYRPLGINWSSFANSETIGAMNRIDAVKLGDFDNGTLIFQLDNTMKNISDKLQHTIEGIGKQISCLEDETCKLDNYVDDVKNCEKRYHEMTHQKLIQMHSILQEVQDGVLFLRDKNEIAETKLQLAILQDSIREKISGSSCNTSFLSQRSHEHTLPRTVSYHPVVPQAHEIIVPQYVFPLNQQPHTLPQKTLDLQFPHFIQSQLRNASFIQISNPRNYDSEFHAKYMPKFTSFSNIYLHDEPSSSYEISNVKPVEPYLHPQEESSRSNYNYTRVTQTLPYALPTTIDIKGELRSEENGNTYYQ